MNIRSVFVHMLGDTLSTAAVIVGGFAISLTGQQWIDPLLSLIIAGMILWSSIGIVRETLHILLEGTPRGVVLEDVRTAIEGVSGVVNAHDLHIWSVGPKALALVSHVTVVEMPLANCTALMESINAELRTRFQIRHTTLQFETGFCGVTHDCSALLTAAPEHDHGMRGTRTRILGTATRPSIADRAPGGRAVAECPVPGNGLRASTAGHGKSLDMAAGATKNGSHLGNHLRDQGTQRESP